MFQDFSLSLKFAILLIISVYSFKITYLIVHCGNFIKKYGCIRLPIHFLINIFKYSIQRTALSRLAMSRKSLCPLQKTVGFYTQTVCFCLKYQVISCFDVSLKNYSYSFSILNYCYKALQTKCNKAPITASQTGILKHKKMNAK